MKEIKLNSFSWIDIQKPTKDDIQQIRKRFDLHPILAEDLLTPTLRPKAVEYGNALYLVIHVPLYNTEARSTYPAEVDFIIADSVLITCHDLDIYQISEFIKELEQNKKDKMYHKDDSAGALLYYLLEMLLESCFPKLDHISKKLENIEKEIFAGNEKDMVFEISVVKRDILNFRRTMKPQRTVVESLGLRTYRLVDVQLRPYFQDLVSTNIRIWNSLENAKETIESLEATNNSLLSNKLDMTMKILTIFSAVMLPLTVYSNILAMSASIPFGNHPYGFWIHISIMLFLAITTITFFKIKKWL